MTPTALVSADTLDAELARLSYEADVTAEALRILEQARHRVLACVEPGHEYGAVLAEKIAEGADELADRLNDTWQAKARLVQADLEGAVEVEAVRLDLAVDVDGWYEAMDRLREANRAEFGRVRALEPAPRCEGWCREPCPPSALTRISGGGHSVLLCPACLARLEWSAWPPATEVVAAAKPVRKRPRSKATNGNGG